MDQNVVVKKTGRCIHSKMSGRGRDGSKYQVLSAVRLCSHWVMMKFKAWWLARMSSYKHEESKEISGCLVHRRMSMHAIIRSRHAYGSFAFQEHSWYVVALLSHACCKLEILIFSFHFHVESSMSEYEPNLVISNLLCILKYSSPTAPSSHPQAVIFFSSEDSWF